ncbi:MAG: hypothetical protein M3Y81_26345 [Chloroflexota bacterium]|nr:hypothetical protein [Chloroflexota bacterium]
MYYLASFDRVVFPRVGKHSSVFLNPTGSNACSLPALLLGKSVLWPIGPQHATEPSSGCSMTQASASLSYVDYAQAMLTASMASSL